MSAILGELGNATKGTMSEALAFAAGFATARALEPAAVTLAQDAWSAAAIRALDARAVAEARAEGLAIPNGYETEASYTGIDSDRLDVLYDLTLTAPGYGEIVRALRRGTLTPGNARHAFRKAHYEPMWDDALLDLRHERLDPAVIALGIVRGVIADPGILPVGPPTATGRVPAFPRFDVDALDEAAAAGYDRTRLSVLVANMGRPASPDQAARAMWRGHIEATDYRRAIAEGDVRNEWADAILESMRTILSPAEYAELRVRGWIDTPTMIAGIAKHGMDAHDADLLYRLHGRPIPVHQVTTGLARGGTYNGDTSHIPEAYLRSMEQGSSRPEWYNLEYANRYTLPSFFVLRQLVSSGAVTETHAVQLFEQEGWPPDLAKLAARSFAQGAGSHAKSLTAAEHLTEYVGGFETRDGLLRKLKELGYSPADAEAYAELADARRVGSARTQRTGRIRTRYVGHHITEAEARTALNEIPVAESAREDLLADWTAERDVNETQLTQAQVVKAFKKGVWTREQTTEALLERGMSAADVEVLLNEQ